jgi:hypothetical protein
VNPTRDLDIISEELRLKDIEFTEKALENQKKKTRQGGQSLQMRTWKEEEATIEKILAMLKDGKDVRKGNWGPKEVCCPRFHFISIHNPDLSSLLHDDKGANGPISIPSSSIASLTQRLHEIKFTLISQLILHLLPLLLTGREVVLNCCLFRSRSSTLYSS